MHHKKLRKIRRSIDQLRRKGGVKPREVEAIARSLGRKPNPRGPEVNWVNQLLPSSFPISIPHHGEDLNKFTKNNILNQLEEDVDMFD